jgi:putative transposase
MTAPRQILPHATYLLTRCCLGRMFLLRPSPLTNAILRYVLSVAAARYGVLVHAFCFLSNHYHLVVTDPGGRLPAFAQYLDAQVARALNALHGRWDYFWESSSYSAVALQTPEDVLAKIAYVLANPSSAGLVRRGSDWPGLWSAPEQIGGAPILTVRPDHFFRRNGPMPEAPKLQLACPAGFASVQEFRQQLAAAVTELEDQAARNLAAEGRSFLGASKVMAQKPDARPAPVEPRRGLNPRVAARDRWKRIEAIGRLKSFLTEYRLALQEFSRGMRDALFPRGTYWMRVAYGVRCVGAG